jgi:hypothetical protein
VILFLLTIHFHQFHLFFSEFLMDSSHAMQSSVLGERKSDDHVDSSSALSLEEPVPAVGDILEATFTMSFAPMFVPNIHVNPEFYRGPPAPGAFVGTAGRRTTVCVERKPRRKKKKNAARNVAAQVPDVAEVEPLALAEPGQVVVEVEPLAMVEPGQFVDPPVGLPMTSIEEDVALVADGGAGASVP